MVQTAKCTLQDFGMQMHHRSSGKTPFKTPTERWQCATTRIINRQANSHFTFYIKKTNKWELTVIHLHLIVLLLAKCWVTQFSTIHTTKQRKDKFVQNERSNVLTMSGFEDQLQKRQYIVLVRTESINCPLCFRFVPWLYHCGGVEWYADFSTLKIYLTTSCWWHCFTQSKDSKNNSDNEFYWKRQKQGIHKDSGTDPFK